MKVQSCTALAPHLPWRRRRTPPPSAEPRLEVPRESPSSIEGLHRCRAQRTDGVPRSVDSHRPSKFGEASSSRSRDPSAERVQRYVLERLSCASQIWPSRRARENPLRSSSSPRCRASEGARRPTRSDRPIRQPGERSDHSVEENPAQGEAAPRAPSRPRSGRIRRRDEQRSPQRWPAADS